MKMNRPPLENHVAAAEVETIKLPAVLGRSAPSNVSFESCLVNLNFSSNIDTNRSEYSSSNPVKTVSLIALDFRLFSPNAIAVSRSSWSSSLSASSFTDSDDSSFFLYARSVRHACSVAILSVPNSLKFPVLFVRPRESRDARDGRLLSFPFGLGGGLRDRFRPLRRIEESSDAEFKCFEFTGGTGGNAKVGEFEDRPYLEVFRLTTLGGERLLVGVERGDAL